MANFATRSSPITSDFINGKLRKIIVVDKVFVGNINKETSRQEIEEVCVTVHLNNKLLV
jgi:hypothetical protein